MKRGTIIDTIMEEKRSANLSKNAPADVIGSAVVEEEGSDVEAAIDHKDKAEAEDKAEDESLSRASFNILSRLRMSMGLNNPQNNEEDDEMEGSIDESLPKGAGSHRYLGWNDSKSAGIAGGVDGSENGDEDFFMRTTSRVFLIELRQPT